MSEKTAKELRKQKEAESLARMQAFQKEAKAISQKYRIDIRPQLVTTNLSGNTSEVKATMVLIDVIDEYEHVEPPKETNA